MHHWLRGGMDVPAQKTTGSVCSSGALDQEQFVQRPIGKDLRSLSLG